MQKKNHLWLGAVFVLGFIILLGWLNLNWISFSIGSLLSIVVITVLYSLLPDIDHKSSTITWWFFSIGVLGLVIGMIGVALHITIFNGWAFMITSTLLLVLTYLSATLFDHRGIIHSIPVGVLCSVPLFFIFNNVIYCIIGYIAWHSHLIGDGYLAKMK